MIGKLPQRFHLVMLWVVSLCASGLAIAALLRLDQEPTGSEGDLRTTAFAFGGHSIRISEGEDLQGIPGSFSGIRLDAAEGVIAIGFSSSLSGPFLALLPAPGATPELGEAGRGIVLELAQDGASLTVESETGRIVAASDGNGARFGMTHGVEASAGIHLLDEESIFQLDSGIGGASLARLYVSGDNTALTLGTNTSSPQANSLKVLVSGVVKQLLHGTQNEFLLK